MSRFVRVLLYLLLLESVCLCVGGWLLTDGWWNRATR
jgi:hypothetical protein